MPDPSPTLKQRLAQPSDVIDLGGIEAARGTEMYLPLWLRIMGALGSAAFNVRVVR